MKSSSPNIAIVTPSQNAYSETFIEAHKNLLDGNVSYYYGTASNIKLEGKGEVLGGTKKLIGKAIDAVSSKKLQSQKKALLNSWKKNRIDVLFFEYGTTAAQFIDVIKESGLPLIIHFHGYDASAHATLKEFEKQYAAMFSYATYVIVVSEVMHKKLLEIGCPKEKIVKNIYGPSDIFFDLEPAFSKSQFLSVGRFTGKKAPYYTLLAFNEVLKEFPEATLVLCGDGTLLETCENICRYYQIEKSVKFAGAVTPEQIKNYLKESLAFVQHSITAKNGDMEGTPLAVLESSAAGLPVIASKHAGIPEVIIDGETGLLFEEHDVETMAKHMKSLLKDKQLAKEMGAKGRLNIRSNFSMKRHIDILNGLILKASNS
ncbi:glycosyltransferase family 4 protein [Flavobacterium lindanitolerans]|uniref:Glycosyltransferase involved in cell wall biosynthesis n=1 Tax=Flavobacterium lindanitolerans TaxID=428988 RepID=A0A497U7S5_9FLAO|nr:glycosyltransferase family 4 protein [Flavobacterium lindanitolerans]PKW20276.1 glycosyltransferase involved in cell wall biosynthesis [Flavobacterium lindanitolerans]RLJ23766.1 glycosyltransferase involved in cell wall biosynthesis [Flavobacterium lindanitolerans]